MPRLHQSARFLGLFLVCLTFVACGSGNDESTPTPAAQTATTEAAPTAEQGQTTLGELLDRIDAAWSTVESYRITSTSGSAPDASGQSSPNAQKTVEEWSAPNNRRIIQYTNDQVTDESVYVNSRVFMYGSFVASAIAPEVGPNAWVVLDPSVIPSDTPVGSRVAFLTRDPANPFADVTGDLRATGIRETGTATIGGRRCTVYAFAGSSEGGEGISYELAIDEGDLPCQLVKHAGSVRESTVYEINPGDVRIIAPDAGTPVNGTPEG